MNLILPPEERVVMEALKSAMKPAYEATTELSGEKYKYGSKVSPVIQGKEMLYTNSIKEQCQLQNPNPIAFYLLTVIHTVPLEQFGDVEAVEILALSTPRDPCY